ncbi:hypothetical protein B0T09DRAFT_394048, partial [Sordaria sp. MPI-SDFR-AT-0083]
MSSYWARKAQSYNSSGTQARSFGNNWKQTSSTPTTPPPPLGPLLKSLRVNDLDDDPDNQHSATIQGCEVVASYNWLDTNLSNPTILIPGKPPLWSPPPGQPPQLREDSGTYHRDRNAARYPSHPLEPALVSYLRSNTNTTKPSISTSASPIPSPDKIDIVACSSTLGNLLRFVRGQDKTFRILVEKVENTVFFVRRENSPTETIPDGSSSHQRVVRYRFGGMGMLVRFEADGYVRDGSGKGGEDGEAGKVKKDGGDEDVDALLSGLKLSSDSTTTSSSGNTGTKTSSSSPALTIKERPNSLVPQSQIFDLKTRSIRARGVKDTLSEELPRLWISQIPRFILAYHTRGLFRKEDTEIKDVREDVKRWEKEQKDALGKLVGLLKRIREVIEDIEGGKMELVHREDAVGVLEVREQGWPEETPLDEGIDGDLSVKKEKGKTIDKIRGDKVMSDAFRTQWIVAQMGTAEDKQSDTREKKNPENEEGEDISDHNEDEKRNKDTARMRTSKSLAGRQTRGGAFATNSIPRGILRTGTVTYGDDLRWQSDSDGAGDDFTACSKDCAWCGRCPY